jgi:hypothetical protein
VPVRGECFVGIEANFGSGEGGFRGAIIRV